MNLEALCLLAAFAADLLFGDPRWLPHPVRGFGRCVPPLERFWRWAGQVLGLRPAGVLFFVTAAGGAAAFVWLTLWAASAAVWLLAAACVYWAYSLLAARDLDVEAQRVIRELERGDLPTARGQLAMIVGRDTASLDEPEMLRAVVETVAENINDGVVAPLFYFTLGGPVGMAFYKAVNTLDSMVGYRNERYREFGWASARADDVLNFVPARLTAGLMSLAALPLRLNFRRALQIILRDAHLQPSPNAGYPEAAMAGALGVRLGGVSFYEGKPSRKPQIGDPLAALSVGAYRQARKVLYATSGLAVFMAVCLTNWLRP